MSEMHPDIIVVKDSTDYDFYVTHSEKLETYLLDIGFDYTYGHGTEYMDNEAISILERDNIQIVMRKDAEFYKKIFDNINPDFYAVFLWKSSPHFNGNREFIGTWFDQTFMICREFYNK